MDDVFVNVQLMSIYHNLLEADRTIVQYQYYFLYVNCSGEKNDQTTVVLLYFSFYQKSYVTKNEITMADISISPPFISTISDG